MKNRYIISCLFLFLWIGNNLMAKETAIQAIVNSNVPNSITLDKTKLVGEIPITSSTSPTGAMTYTVPIEIYPGINGFQPQIALSYNNQAGNGIAGMGWNISGISSIYRSNKNIYYDLRAEGITFEKDNPFMLDGMRLIQISSSTSQINYQSEIGNVKATAYLSGNSVLYFKVFYPNGITGTFGYTTTTAPQLDYPVTVLTDRFGNNISFTYTFANSKYKLTKITYGGGSKGSIEFQYSTSRVDPLSYYNAGMKVVENGLLQKITCKYGTTTLRTYDLSYISPKNISLLKQINLNSSGASVNPLIFYYGEGKTEIAYKNIPQTLAPGTYYEFDNPGSMRIAKGKYDYNTDDEVLISLPHKRHYIDFTNSIDPNHISRYYYSDYTGNEDIVFYARLNGTQVLTPSIKTGNGFVDILCANLDGKDEEEIIRINNNVSAGMDQIIFNVYGQGGTNPLVPKYTRTFNFRTVLNVTGTNNIHPKDYFVGDFNGDGKMEILAVSAYNPLGTGKASYCYVFDLDANKLLYEGSMFTYNKHFSWEEAFVSSGGYESEEIANMKSDRLFVIDYNGDGKSDICLINDSGTHIYTFDISRTDYTSRLVASYTGLKKSDLKNTNNVKTRDLLVGDINGDGKTDFLLSPLAGSGNAWSCHYSKGNGSMEKVDQNITSRTANDYFILQDVNSDGMLDLIKCTGNLGYTYLNTNGKISTMNENTFSITANSILVPTNMISRYAYSSLIMLKNNKINILAFPRNDGKERMITGVANSMGVVQKTQYRLLNEGISSGSDYTNFYHKGYTNTDYPHEHFVGPLAVVYRSDVYMNGFIVEDKTMAYQSAILNKHGLGFRGFQKITTTDNMRTRSVSNTYDPVNYGVLKESESPESKTTNTYNVSVQSNKTVQVSLSNSTIKDVLKGTTKTVAYVYDSYINPTKETVSFGDGITVTTDNTYSNSTGTPYLLGFLTNQTVTTTRNSISTSQKMYIPNHSNGLPTKKILYKNGYQVSESTFTYDSKGNKTSEIIKPYSSTDLLEYTYRYDTEGRLKSELDPMNAEITYSYVSTNGLLSSTTDSRFMSGTTSYNYDALGRLSSSSDYQNITNSIAYAWESKGTNGLYKKTSTTTGQPTLITYYDALGREVRMGSARFNGTYSYTDREYDIRDKFYKESLPFTGTAPTYWNTYNFDIYGRPTSNVMASGKTTAYSYSGNSTTTTEKGVAIIRVCDAQGNLIQVRDPMAIMTYNLRPDGQPNSIVAQDRQSNSSVTTSFTYDGYGRQTSIVDPSAGTKKYAYDNATGNMISQTDANGKIINMGYDAYNRLRTVTYPEFTVNYNYLVGTTMPTTKRSSNGSSIVYQYNNNGTVYSETETTTDGKSLQKIFSYASGNVASIQYKSQDGVITTENYYYSNGHLSEIKLDGLTSIWKLSSVNTLNQPTGVTTGSVARSYTYDNYGTQTGRAAGTFQSFNYTFDANRGNLTSRKDVKTNIQETFNYDGLNRMYNYAGKTTAYDWKGNITSRSDVGTFSYTNASKPYAVTGAATTGGQVSAQRQTVTYTSFMRPNTITESAYTASFVYNPDGQRNKMEIKKNGSKELIRHYLSGCYEIDDQSVGGIKQKLYLGGDFYSAPAVYIKTGTGSWQLYHIYRDYLGSITHIASGTSVAQQLSYDAWGRLRNPANQSVYTTGTEPTLLLGRGYTGHEHLPMFGLINMNARLYDPVAGRFLSPDPYVQMPDMSQNYNRYSYAMNNPMCYIDQDGEFIWFIVGGALIGAYIGASAKGGSWNPGKWQGNWWQGAITGGLVGAAGGAFVGSMWAAGGISFALAGSAYNLTFPIATASLQAGSYGTLALGAGLWGASGLVYKFGKKDDRDVTPWDVGVEWLSGTGPRERIFYDGYYFTELLKQHNHIENTRDMLINNFNNQDFSSGKNDYELSGLQGVGKYIKDYSTLATVGLTGNLAVTYLGSYRLKYEVLSNNKSSASVRFTVTNSSTIESALRPPVIGYSKWWKNNIGTPLKERFSTGPMSEINQTFIWTETLFW